MTPNLFHFVAPTVSPYPSAGTDFCMKFIRDINYDLNSSHHFANNVAHS